MASKLTEKEETPGVWESLPIVSKMSKKDMKISIELLEEMQLLEEQADTNSGRKEEIIDELLRLQQRYKLPGFRYGRLAFKADPNKPGSRLNANKLKELLIEKGVKPTVIKSCFDAATEESQVKKPFKCQYKELS